MNAPTIDDLIDQERAAGVLHGPFWRDKYLSRAPERVRRELLLAQRFPHLRAARFSQDTTDHPGCLDRALASATTISTAVQAQTETVIYAAAIYSSIPANDASPGCGYEVTMGGICSTGTAAAQTGLSFRVYWGQNPTIASNVSVAAANIVNVGQSLAAVPWLLKFVFTIRDLGTSGHGTGNGIWTIGRPGSGNLVIPIGKDIATIDTTTAQGLTVTGKWNSVPATGTHTLTAQWIQLRNLN